MEEELLRIFNKSNQALRQKLNDIRSHLSLEMSGICNLMQEKKKSRDEN